MQPTEDWGWVSGGTGTQLTLPGTSGEPGQCGVGQLQTQSPFTEGFQEEEQGRVSQMPLGRPPVHFLLSAAPRLRS